MLGSYLVDREMNLGEGVAVLILGGIFGIAVGNFIWQPRIEELQRQNAGCKQRNREVTSELQECDAHSADVQMNYESNSTD
jgi:flagellar motor component MotA